MVAQNYKYIIMRKLALLLAFYSLFFNCLAQSGIPFFLQGTWKMEGAQQYEHWDFLASERMKGVSYIIEDEQIYIMEYLDMELKSSKVLYTATVPGQNGGKSIEFLLTETGAQWVFENPDHDFPNKIVYRKISDNEIFVEISGKKGDVFSYKMQKTKN